MGWRDALVVRQAHHEGYWEGFAGSADGWGEAAFLAGVGAPEAAAGVGGFEVPVLAAGEFRPIKREAGADQFGGKIAPVGQEALGHHAVVGQFRQDAGGDRLALAELDQRPLGLLPEGMIELGRIDAGQAQPGAIDIDGIAVDHPAPTMQDGLWRRRRW